MPMKQTAVKTPPKKPELPCRNPLALDIAEDLRIVLRYTQSHSKLIEKHSGVSEAQLVALRHILASPGLKVSGLSKMLSIHQSTASNMLDKLEHKLLVKRERGSLDHRAVHLYITNKGVRLLSMAPSPQQNILTAALNRMSDQELHTLHVGLANLLKNMERSEQEFSLSQI